VVTTPETGRPRWRPTAALARAVVLGGVLLLLAVLLRRPDLVVLGAPLLLGAGIGLATRPSGKPTLTLAGPVDALLEGGRAAATATVDVPAGVDVAAVGIVLPAGMQPLSGASAIFIEGRREVRLTFRAVRWGRRRAGPAYLRATGGYGMLSWPVVRSGTVSVATWPLRDGFDAAETVPRAEGLVGAHRSRRAGEGGDVAGVRQFQPGDRLRRINWRVTGRTGDLHVTATYSDRDTEVLLVLDSGQDLGRPPETSLDIGVRAAAAVAEHYLRAGDRVGFIDLGRPQRPVPARNGRNHLVRLLDVMLDARPQGGGALPSLAEVAYLGSTDALVVLLSPLATPEALAAVATLSRSGRSVIAVDTLPPDLRPDERSPWTALAFRLWVLRRDADLSRLAELGVPRVAWRGSGSLDAVLRDAALAARAARAGR
jgi:uncharacterized protein (DUF58 family)